jgi:DNA-binding MarR family transcriptional regulator
MPRKIVPDDNVDQGSRSSLRLGIATNCKRFAEDADACAVTVDLMMTLRRTATALETSLHSYMREYDLSPAKVTILMALSGVEGQTLSQGDIGRRASVSLGNLTSLVVSLEKAKLIKRYRHPNDARVTLLSLTAAGNRLVARFAPFHYRYVAEMFSRLNRREQQTLNELLDRVREEAKKPRR